MSINPNAADGKVSCSDSSAKFGTLEQAECPSSPRLERLLSTARSCRDRCRATSISAIRCPGTKYRLFLVADGFGVHVRLPGSVTPDPQTGQLVISFENLPQSPFADFNLHVFGSERGILATPTKCGTYPVKTTFIPWDGALPDQSSTEFFTISSGPGGTPCPGSTRPFSPGFSSASVSNTAGAHTPFAIEVTRPDGDQNLSGLTVKTPPGFSATLKGIPYCSDAAIITAASPAYSGLAEEANPSCSAASQIGTASAGAGAGDHPVYLPGKVYLAGPYRGRHSASW